MYQKLIPLFFACMVTACAGASGPHKEFRSWYDGWGTHKVWGLGIVKAPYALGSVSCGGTMFKVTPAYDIHADAKAPSTEQTGASLSKLNIALAAELERQGVKCAFESDPRGDASWLSVAEQKAH